MKLTSCLLPLQLNLVLLLSCPCDFKDQSRHVLRALQDDGTLQVYLLDTFYPHNNPG